MFEAPPSNVGNIYVSESLAQMAAGNRLTLQPGQSIEVEIDDTDADEDLVFIDLRDLYMDGSSASDQLVVAYLVEQSIDY